MSTILKKRARPRCWRGSSNDAVTASGFLGGANMFRSLTLSPMDSMLQQAHQARRHLEAGGTAAPTPKQAKADLAPRDYILPLDVDADQVRQAIEAKLRDGASESPVLERRAGGRIAVPACHLLRLGDGRFDRGRQFKRGLLKRIRARRMRRTAPITGVRAGTAGS